MATSDDTGPIGANAARGRAAVEVWRAETDSGREWTIPTELALDAIDEFLTELLPHVDPDAPELGGTVHVHTTDEGRHGEWLIVVDDDGRYVVTAEHAKGSCALRGAASDILLVLWRCLPLSMLDVVGDADVAARFVSRTVLD